MIHTTHFAGRTEFFSWLQQQINQANPATVLLLAGPAQIGKTAVLHQLHHGRLGPDAIPVYVDLAQLRQHTASAFFWELAQTAAADFNQKRHLPTKLEQAGFVADPLRALSIQFLQPVMTWLDGRRLLLLLDNLHSLKMNVDASENGPLASLLTWLRRQTAVTGILTLTQETADLTPEWASHLAGFERLFIQPLTLGDVADLLRQTHPVLMANAVIQHIYDMTDGQPAAVQKIGRFLQARMDGGLLKQITLADLAVARKMGIGRS